MVLPPLTLPDSGAHIVHTTATMTSNSFQFKMEFRTFDKDKLLMWNKQGADFEFFLSISALGYVEFELKPKVAQNAYTIKEMARGG